MSSQIMFCKLNMKKTAKAAILDFSFIGLIYMACLKVIFVVFFVCLFVLLFFCFVNHRAHAARF